jgi:hypothetical protein
MTSGIALAVAALLFALSSSVAFARTANVPPRLTAAQARALDWAQPATVNTSDAHRNHGGPKSND